jgi:hypothetical protein
MANGDTNEVVQIDQTLLPDEQFEDPDEEGSEPALNIPAKDRKLVTHPYDFIVRSLRDQINDGTLILADNFQRRRVWSDAKASKLIESLLLHHQCIRAFD